MDAQELAVQIAAAIAIDPEAVEALNRLSNALRPRTCDAIHEETGVRCTLRADHPGDIHEHYSCGRRRQYRCTGPTIRETR